MAVFDIHCYQAQPLLHQMVWSQPGGAAFDVNHPQLEFAQPELQANVVWWLPDGMWQVFQTPHSSPLYLQGQVWTLARDAKGSRVVQKALDDADCDDTRLALAFELRTHVWEALKCPHANHVLQKCIETMRPAHSQFIIDELLQPGRMAVARAARDRFAYRVLQRLFEHCPLIQMKTIADDLLADAVPLCNHMNGKYVMQHLLEHGSPSHVSNLTKVLVEQSSTVGRNDNGPTVLAKALEHASPADQMALANAILAQPDLLISMAGSRREHGLVAAKEALQCAKRYNLPQGSIAIAELMGSMEELNATRYGRLLAAFVRQESEADVN